MPQYPNATVYAEAMIPIVACARRFMPKAYVGACGLSEFGWNVGVRAPRPRPPFLALSAPPFKPPLPVLTASPPSLPSTLVLKP